MATFSVKYTVKYVELHASTRWWNFHFDLVASLKEQWSQFATKKWVVFSQFFFVGFLSKLLSSKDATGVIRNGMQGYQRLWSPNPMILFNIGNDKL